MRIIAGSFRSRTLQAPPGLATRPTSDRLRETLFNVLAPRVQSASFLDLYAGSGAVGIEALSRGAAHVAFVERAPAALVVLRANLARLGLTEGFRIHSGGVSAFLLRPRVDHSPKFDLVFLDPPWNAGQEYAATLNLLGGASQAAEKLARTVDRDSQTVGRDFSPGKKRVIPMKGTGFSPYIDTLGSAGALAPEACSSGNSPATDPPSAPCGSVLLASGALIVAEHRRKEKLADRYGSLERTRLLEQGDAALSFYALPPLAAPAVVEDEISLAGVPYTDQGTMG